MLDLLYLIIGFLIFISYVIITFDIYSKNEILNSPFILIIIFLFYTFLVNYVFSFTDKNAKDFDLFIQTFSYFLIGIIVLLIRYKDQYIKEDPNFKFSKN